MGQARAGRDGWPRRRAPGAYPRRRRVRSRRSGCPPRRGCTGRSPRSSRPQWATRSPSRKPGRASSHSAKVRMGISCLRPVPARVVARPRGARARGPGRATARASAALACRRASRYRGVSDERAEAEQAVEEFGHEGVQTMGPISAAGLPEDLGGGRHAGPYARGRPPRRPAWRAGPRRTAEQPDRRLAVDAGHGHDLIQELAFLGPGRLPIPRPLDRGVLSKAGSRHGSLLGWIGNRDF